MNNSSRAHCTAGGNSESKKEIAQEIGRYLTKRNLTHLTKRHRNSFLRNFNFWQKHPHKKRCTMLKRFCKNNQDLILKLRYSSKKKTKVGCFEIGISFNQLRITCSGK